MILLQYLNIWSHPTHLCVRDPDTATISPNSVPSYSPICQRPWYCFNISTFNPILHTHLSDTRILLQCLHFQSHPTHLFVRYHTVSISPHSIPPYTAICQRPWYCFNISTCNLILHTYLSETRILLQYLHIQSHPTHLFFRDNDTIPLSPHSIPSYTPLYQRPGYCFNISAFNPILHTYPSETMILLQYLQIQSHPTHLSVRDRDAVLISPYSIPSYTLIFQRPGYCFTISLFNSILHTLLSETRILLQYLHIQSHPTHLSVWGQDTGSTSPHSIPHYAPVSSVKSKYCLNISVFNPILHTYLSETRTMLQYLHIQTILHTYLWKTMILIQYLHIQSHPTHLYVRDHDTASIYSHSIPSYTPICHRPGCCFNISTFNPILHTYLSETMILLQYLHIQSHPTHLSFRDHDTISTSPHSIPSYTHICQRPWYCFNISTFNPILHPQLSETRVLLQYLHIQTHPTHLSVWDKDTVSISPHLIQSYTPICHRPGNCFNISTFNPILHTNLSETRMLLQYLHMKSHPRHLSFRDQDTASISPYSIPSFTPYCQRPEYCYNISTFNPILHTYLSEARILVQHLHIQSHTTLLSVVWNQNTVSIYPYSIPSYTPICQRPGHCFNISTFKPSYTLIFLKLWNCFNITTFNPILHTYMSETMTLLQYIPIQSHPTRLSVTDQDAASISQHSIPSYTPIYQRPWYCFNISTFNPILHSYLSEARILLQYIHIQSHPTHLSVRDRDNVSISPHSIPSYTPICQRPGYCFNVYIFNPILLAFLSETWILLQYLHIQSHPTHLSVRDLDTVSISPHSIPSYTPICQRPGYCFNISTFNPILHTYLSETMILFQYLHI